ncbi:STAS-like domain-containing protein [Gammaproteobacteria bacterium]|nr:STAS-like domain-containing protein [Gammaproteobacteria bacterium]
MLACQPVRVPNSMVVVTLESRCTHESLSSAIAGAGLSESDDQQLTFLFKGRCFFDASFIAALVTWGNAYRETGGEINFVGAKDLLDYLSRMDVFRQLNFEYEEDFDRHSEKGRFLPVFPVQDEDSVVEASEAICELVLQRFDNAREFLPAMEWCVSEVIDNVRVHSETATPGAVCAQYYPKVHRLDIAIVDQGRGIRESLSQRLELTSHGEAITRALERGMTRDPNVGQGNGLAGTLEIVAKNAGGLHVWTGDSVFQRNVDGSEAVHVSNMFPGTGVYISLNTNNPVNLEDTFIGDNGWSYISYVAEQAQESAGLKIKDECRHTLGRETARPFRRKIESMLPEMEEVLQLNFEGVRNATSSYLDELLGRLADDIGEQEFRDRIRIVNAPEGLVNMANVVIAQRLAGNPVQDD